MKVHQVTVTSNVETLDNRQGFGLVECSRAMPEPIRQQARDWGYSADANGEPIFSFKHIEISQIKWAVMNRTVPETDFTGRTSYVSHTIAIPLNDIKERLEHYLGRQPSLFEFMLHFEWKGSWNGKPRWIEEDEDIEFDGCIENYQLKGSLPPNCHLAAPLLAFQFTGNAKPLPKRLSWIAGKHSTLEMLYLFHSGWIALDPWRGCCKYEGLLNEPDAPISDSWDCPFTTHLRNERSDPYQWIVLINESSRVGNRDIIDTTAWQTMNDLSIIKQIGEPFGPLLVNRSLGPVRWATKEIQNLMEEAINRSKETFDQCIQDAEERIKSAIDQIQEQLNQHRLECDTLKSRLRTFWCNPDAFRIDDSSAQQARHLLDGAIQELNRTYGNIGQELETELCRLNALLESDTEGGSPAANLPPPRDYEDKRKEFEELAQRLNDVAGYHNALSRENSLVDYYQRENARVKELEGIKRADDEKIRGYVERAATRERENARLKMLTSTKKKQVNWQIPILFGVSILAAFLVGCWYMQSDLKSKTDDKGAVSKEPEKGE